MTTKASPLLIDTGNITSLGTLTSLTVSGNIIGDNANLGNLVTANYFVGSGENLTGVATAGTVTSNAQPNITSIGTLTSLVISGDATLGSVSNVHISGGSSGQYITTDGAGNLSFATVSIPDVPLQPPHPFLFLGI